MGGTDRRPDRVGLRDAGSARSWSPPAVACGSSEDDSSPVPQPFSINTAHMPTHSLWVMVQAPDLRVPDATTRRSRRTQSHSRFTRQRCTDSPGQRRAARTRPSARSRCALEVPGDHAAMTVSIGGVLLPPIPPRPMAGWLRPPATSALDPFGLRLRP